MINACTWNSSNMWCGCTWAFKHMFLLSTFMLLHELLVSHGTTVQCQHCTKIGHVTMHCLTKLNHDPWLLAPNTMLIFCPGDEHPSFGNIVNMQLLVALPDNNIGSVCVSILKFIGRVHCGFIIFNTNHEWCVTPNIVILLFVFTFLVLLFDALFDDKLNNVVSSLISNNCLISLAWCFVVLQLLVLLKWL